MTVASTVRNFLGTTATEEEEDTATTTTECTAAVTAVAAAAAAAAGGEGDRTAADSRPAQESLPPIPYAENTAKSHALLLFFNCF
jgi:hypothetical protein